VQGGAGGRIKLQLETENDKAAYVAKRGERIGMVCMLFGRWLGEDWRGSSRYADGKAPKRKRGIARAAAAN
jgi:hypothetical protein